MNQSEIWAKRILQSNAVIFDTETTGVARDAQVIQLCVIDMRGNKLFDSLFFPTVAIHPTATATHNMTVGHLVSAPRFADLIDEIKAVLSGKTAIAYNVSFDERMIRQTLDAFRLDVSWFNKLDFQCAMRIYAESIGSGKKPKLEGGDHTAFGDCMATLNLLRRMAGEEVVKELPKQERAVLTPSQKAYKTIKKTLLDERAMRERVFKDTAQREKKTGEIDDALAALDLLGTTIRDLQNGVPTSSAVQAKLLG